VSEREVEREREREEKTSRKQGGIKISFDGQLSKPWFASTAKREIPKVSGWRPNIHQNNVWHNDTQHNYKKHDVQNNDI
jgi:hypothetical protein